jgi:squalene-associated FAD-dependent desaturase
MRDEGVVHVVGAGIAGLSAATRLVEAGRAVILHEAAGVAGGRCRSFADSALGLTIDNGNHLLLSGNRSALEYLARIGASDRLTGPEGAIFEFADLRTQERWRLHPSEGRAPWWLFDRGRRAPGTALREYLAPLPLLWARDNSTVREAMACRGPLYERLWRPVLLAGLNTEPEESAAALAAALLRNTLLAGGRACRPLVAAQNLSHAFVDPAIAYLSSASAEIRFGDRLRAMRFEGDRAAVLEFEAAPCPLGPADAVILAVPPWSAEAIIPGLRTPDDFRAIVNAHFQISPPSGTPPILGVIGGMTQWLFAYPDRLSVTISAADDLIDSPRDALAATIWREVAALTGLQAEPPPWRIVKEKRATFAATPKQEARRPTSRTRWMNVALAGDWVQTGLPATLEGAARSGREAAALVGGRVGVLEDHRSVA